MADKNTQPFLLYKGRPLVRSGNQLYYGNMSEPYVVFMQVFNNREVSGQAVADKIVLQLVSTDPDAPQQEQILQNAVRRGLYDALDLALMWLEKAMA
ncbi:MAG: hypothetical protein LBT21_06745 [Oscillospiraceae bacterium]|jgi:hypothetical protein|nr:hypothetical protein [Oscillospiraceae bacterium]